jgi:hypothetical protein
MFILAGKASNKSCKPTSADIMFNTTNGYRVRNRQTSQPGAEAKKIYSLLNTKVSKNTVSKKYRL